jgi:hypothetical protein
MPRVSIVIPTLNRAHLLRSSLRSAIQQSFPDLEVLVFDDMSSDDTSEVATSHTSARVRYVRSPTRLNMSESFEAALEQARGEYITFLTDDSYLLPDCITRAYDAATRHDVPLVVWRHAGYFDEHWVEPARRNTLYIPKVSHRELMFDSRASLEQWFRTIQGKAQWMPRSINSMCHRSVIESAKRAQGVFFLPPAPDHSSGVAMLMNTLAYVAIDEALVVDGVTKESVGPAQSFTRGKSAEDFYRSLGPSLEQATYLGLPATSAIIAKSFERAAAAYPDAPQLRLDVVLAQINDDLAKLDAYGSNVSDSYAVLDEHALRLGHVFRLSLRAARLRSRAKWSAVRLARSNSTLSAAVERLRGLQSLTGGNTQLRGIQEAADLLVEHSRS